MKILFLCTHNRCRSILAEAVANHYGHGLIRAASAGSAPAARIHPKTLEKLAEYGISGDRLFSKSLEECAAFRPDLIVTLCDQAAGEPCPVVFSEVPRIHWSMPDPSAVPDNAGAMDTAFNETIETLRDRIMTISDWLETGTDPDSLPERMAALAEAAS